MRLIMILMLVVFAAIIMVLKFALKDNRQSNLFVIISFFLAPFIMTAVLILIQNSLVNNVVNDAEFTEKIDNVSIYYDDATNQYFRVVANDWNLTQLYYREYLDTETVETYIEHQNALESIDLFGYKGGAG